MGERVALELLLGKIPYPPSSGRVPAKAQSGLPSNNKQLSNIFGEDAEENYNNKYRNNEIIEIAAQVSAARVDLDKKALLLSKLWDWAERASIEDLNAAVARLEENRDERPGIERLRASPPTAKYVLRKATEDRRLSAVEFLEKHYNSFLDGTVTRADIRGFDPDLYQGLTNWLRTNEMPAGISLPPARSTSVRDVVTMGAKTSGQLTVDFGESSDIDLDAFTAHAAKHQWRTRRERGYNWNANVFEYIRDIYSDWIKKFKDAGRPLTQADIKRVDSVLYNRLQHEISSSEGGLPSWLDLPAARVAGLESLPESEKARRAAVREHWKALRKLQRTQDP